MKKKLTIGLRLIQIYAAVTAVLIIVSEIIAMTVPWSVESMTSSVWSTIYIVFSFVFLIVMIVCISWPRPRLYKALLVLIGIDLVLSIVFLFVRYQGLSANVSSILEDALLLWYLTSLKNYFLTGVLDITDPVVKKRDKKFILLAVILFVIVLLVPFTIGIITGIKNGEATAGYTAAFTGKTTPQAVVYCESLPSSQKDQCLFSIVGISDNSQEAKTVFSDGGQVTPEICSMITDKGDAVGCYASINRCDLVTDSSLQNICSTAAAKIQSYSASSTVIQTESSSSSTSSVGQ